MAREHRTTIDTLEQTLLELNERIHSFGFIAAVRQLENAYPDKPRVGTADRVTDDIVRLSQNVTLGFTGCELDALSAQQGAHKHRLYVNFLGLLGSNGPMPLHLTEYADQRARNHSDPTFKEFLDLFNHRMLSLFYRASVQFDPSVCFDRPADNNFDEYLGALIGLVPESAQNRDAIDDSTKRYYPGWFGSSAKSPDGIAAIIGNYFDLPVKVQEWIGEWIPIPEESLTRLGNGAESSQLGRAAYIGKQIWSIRHKFRIQLGPVDWQTFNSFRPGSKRAKSLHDLLRNYVGDEWDWDLELKLKSREVQPLKLDRSCVLGFDSWMRSSNGKCPGSQSTILNRKLISEQRAAQGATA